MKFGDAIENIHASLDNPYCKGFYVREVFRSGKLNPGLQIEMTDGRGEFWVVNASAIRHKAHLAIKPGSRVDAGD